jgi:transposase-like protein
MPPLVNLSSLIDDAKCYELVRQHRWPDGVRCPHCESAAVARHGRDDTQPHRQRYRCTACGSRFDDLTGTILAGHHQPLRVWVLCLYFMGLNLSNRQIAKELDLGTSDVQAMTEQLRQGLTARAPAVILDGEIEIDEVYVVAGHKGNPAKEKPPILGLLQRGGEVVVRMLANVQQTTIRPLIEANVVQGALVHTDEYDVYVRLDEWGYGHKTVCHGRGEYARDEDGDGFCEVHVNTAEGFWSLLRSWLRPHRGISQEKLPAYLGFFQFVHNARRRGKALLGTLIAGLVAETDARHPETR